MLIVSFFFFNDTATTEIYTLPYTTLFRSADVVGRDPGPQAAGGPAARTGAPPARRRLARGPGPADARAGAAGGHAQPAAAPRARRHRPRAPLERRRRP